MEAERENLFSLGDWFLRRWANWQKNSQDPSRVALGTLTISDAAEVIRVRRENEFRSMEARA